MIEGNWIGTNVAGTAALANAGDGIDVRVVTTTGLGGGGVVVNGAPATIGGTSAGCANIISGNSGSGIDSMASCLVEGNLIGTSPDGTAAMANASDGVYVGAANATIGGSAAGTGNVISGNLKDGIDIEASCLVEGNLIGTDMLGDAALANAQLGVNVGTAGATIGGTSSGEGNVISGNDYFGVYIGASCLVEGNLVGTDALGDAAVANGSGGVFVNYPGVTIGGTSAGAGNVISGNNSVGVNIAAPCLVQGNLIGTNESGTAAVANTGTGINVYNGDYEFRTGSLIVTAASTIGGAAAAAGNLISGNSGNGIESWTWCVVEGNLIGTDATGVDPVPNHGMGIDLNVGSAVANTIGAAGAANIIAFNSGPGVATSPGTSLSTIRFNSIFSNGGPGIDLNDDGVTANTPEGANNSPVLTSTEAQVSRAR